VKSCAHCDCVFSSAKWTCPVCAYEPDQVGGVIAHTKEDGSNGIGFKSEYFADLSDLEPANFWFRARNAIIVWALRTYGLNIKKFLEIGCGTGFVLSGISQANPHMEITGSEIFQSGLSCAARRIPSGNFMRMDARNIPFVAEFDAIGAFDVLEHIEEDELVLSQIHKAIKPDGILLVTVPQHPRLWSTSDEYACHVRRYTRHQIESKISQSGFEIIRSSSFVTTLLPAMVLSRLSCGGKVKQFDPTKELRINSILNKFFYGLMMLELGGMKIGLNYPIGGSRLVIARKTVFR